MGAQHSAAVTDGFNLVAPTAEQRAAFDALQAEVRQMALIFAGPASTPAKLDGLATDCERAGELLRRLRSESVKASLRRRPRR